MSDFHALNSQQQRSLLESLLPHRSPILLLERLLNVEDESARAELVISPDSAFYRADMAGVPSWVGLEYMAQTVAAWSGQQLLNLGRPVAIGFLLGTRAYRTRVPVFASGMRLRIDIDVTYLEPSGLSSFDCIIRGGDSQHPLEENDMVLAEARINAFRPEDPLNYVREGVETLRGERP